MSRFTQSVCIFLAALFALPPLAAFGAPAEEEAAVLVMGDDSDNVEKLDSISIANVNDSSTYVSLGFAEQDGLRFWISTKDPANQGFRDPALGAARFECVRKALQYEADVMNMPGALNVMLGASEYDGTGAMVEGGTLFPVTPGFTNGSAEMTLWDGHPRFPNYCEVVLTVDWGYSWHLGDGFPPSTQFDLRSVVLHEVTHALGFVSLMTATGGSKISPGVYSQYDNLLQRSSDGGLMVDNFISPVFTGNVADLTGNALVFAGAHATAAFSGSPPIFAPSPFTDGSSIQHWRQSVVGQAVMNPALAPGAVQRAYKTFEIGVLRDLGYSSAAEGNHDGDCPLTGVTITEPGPSAFTVDASGTATVSLRSAVEFNFGNPLCLIENGNVRVDYLIDGTLRTWSSDEQQQFHADVTLEPGNHVITAVARHAVITSEVSATKNVSVSTSSPPGPVLQATPADATHSFGDIHKHETSYQAFTVTNTGGGTLNGAASLSGDEEFTFVSASTYSLTAGASIIVTTSFSPTNKGDFSGTLTFGGNGGTQTVALTGRCVRAAGLFACSGLPDMEPWNPVSDLFVLFAAATTLLLARRRAAGR